VVFIDHGMSSLTISGHVGTHAYCIGILDGTFSTLLFITFKVLEKLRNTLISIITHDLVNHSDWTVIRLHDDISVPYQLTPYSFFIHYSLFILKYLLKYTSLML